MKLLRWTINSLFVTFWFITLLALCYTAGLIGDPQQLASITAVITRIFAVITAAAGVTMLLFLVRAWLHAGPNRSQWQADLRSRLPLLALGYTILSASATFGFLA